MGKVSSIIIALLMVNIIGFLLMSEYVPNSENVYIQENSLLQKLYTPMEDGDGNTLFVVGEGSELYGSVPQEPPESFIENVGQFIDRIFILFDFIRVILGVLVFPIALISFLGIPWQLSMLLFPPLTLLYVLGLIDIFSGGNS